MNGPGWTGSFVIWVYAGDENGQASEALANNDPADDAEARFHDALYGARRDFGQGQSACRLHVAPLDAWPLTDFGELRLSQRKYPNSRVKLPRPRR